jgi:hypothetical protein
MIKWLTLRPTFEIPIETSRDEAIAKIAESAKEFGEPKIFFAHGEYGELHLPTDQHRFWSPHLSFYVSQEQQGAVIRGRFAPRLEVWTLVWVMYLATIFTAFFSALMHFSMWSLNEKSWWNWLTVAALVALTAIYIIANVGQQWSSDQMKLLRDQLEGILAQAGMTEK